METKGKNFKIIVEQQILTYQENLVVKLERLK